LSFRVQGQDCESLNQTLGQRGFALRSGLHCAPQAHRLAGTLETGTLRASVSAFNTQDEIDCFAAVLSSLLQN
jgi:selenocysteine lyase/cysteine desulfurase